MTTAHPLAPRDEKKKNNNSKLILRAKRNGKSNIA